MRFKIPDLEASGGRRGWAMLALLGGCIVFTILAAVGVYLVSGNVKYSFYLALAAHAQIMIGITSLGALLVRRSVKVTKDGLELEDLEVQPDEPVEK